VTAPVILLATAAVLCFSALVADARGYRYIAALLGALAVLVFTCMLTALFSSTSVLDAPPALPSPPAPQASPLPSHGPACVDLAWLDETWKCIPAEQAG